MARIVSYNHDSENVEINCMDRQMSYRNDFETHKISLTRKLSYKMDSPVSLDATKKHLPIRYVYSYCMVVSLWDNDVEMFLTGIQF